MDGRPDKRALLCDSPYIFCHLVPGTLTTTYTIPVGVQGYQIGAGQDQGMVGQREAKSCLFDIWYPHGQRTQGSVVFCFVVQFFLHAIRFI